MEARSIKGNSVEEIEEALQQSMTSGFKPTLSIIFLSVKQDRDAVFSACTAEEVAANAK